MSHNQFIGAPLLFFNLRDVFLPAVAVLILASCADGSSDIAATDDLPEIEIQTRWADLHANSLESLWEFADAIFVGRVEEVVGVSLRSISRSEAGPTQPPVAHKPATDGPPEFPMSLYSVRITHSIVGGHGVGTLVALEQPGGETTGKDGSRVRVMLESDELMEPDETYLFFAAESDGALSAPPFARMRLGNDGLFEALEEWRHVPALSQLAGLQADEVISKVVAGAHR